MDLVILPILSLLGCSRVTTVTLEWVGYVPLNVFIIDWAMIIKLISFTIASFPDLLASFPDLLASFPDLYKCHLTFPVFPVQSSLNLALVHGCNW